ncbi:uncharacterized protein LOC143020923 isoform X2 [Oratosquilla oratoria]|uniref:uncharacterized protein LOC143020923 isoform X2 n=1 Tax=Oratosquilla oratoria TaxID=337810 RepID=UPI003F75EF22
MEWSLESTIKFIEDYRNAPELWKASSLDYKNIKLKGNTLRALATKYNCRISDIKKKIKNLRSAFHRERKKVLRMRSNGGKGKVWFGYSLLTFLDETYIPRRINLKTDDGDDFEDGEIEMDPLEKVEEDIQDGSQLSSSPEMNGEAGSAFHGDGLSLHPKKLEQSIGTPELSMECTLSELPGMPSSAVAPENNNDDAHFMGALVECELRAMNARQKCFVKKLISDAIYYGNLQMLCHASHIVCQPDNSQQDIKFPQQT